MYMIHYLKVRPLHAKYHVKHYDHTSVQSLRNKHSPWWSCFFARSAYNEESLYRTSHTVKPAHAFTSIKQSPVLKSHIFLVLSQKISYELNLF